jgi:hypothetical protein
MEVSVRCCLNVIGQPFGADAVNAAIAPVQRQVVESLGVGALATIAA